MRTLLTPCGKVLAENLSLTFDLDDRTNINLQILPNRKKSKNMIDTYKCCVHVNITYK